MSRALLTLLQGSGCSWCSQAGLGTAHSHHGGPYSPTVRNTGLHGLARCLLVKLADCPHEPAEASWPQHNPETGPPRWLSQGRRGSGRWSPLRHRPVPAGKQEWGIKTARKQRSHFSYAHSPAAPQTLQHWRSRLPCWVLAGSDAAEVVQGRPAPRTARHSPEIERSNCRPWCCSPIALQWCHCQCTPMGPQSYADGGAPRSSPAWYDAKWTLTLETHAEHSNSSEADAGNHRVYTS